MTNSLVVFSGGQDSTTVLFKAIHYHRQRQDGGGVHALTFGYGQRHFAEVQAASDIISRLRTGVQGVITHEMVDLGGQLLRSTSPLVGSEPLETYENHDEMERVIGNRVEKTFVPMRNMLFFTLAANRAAAMNCTRIWTGVCQADNANYPDCRYSFVEATENAINEALGRSPMNTNWISIVAPLLMLSKASSIREALRLPGCYAALAYSHTAYDGKYPPASKDHASILRGYGFEQAGVPDPLVLRAWCEGRMLLPGSLNYDPFRGTEPMRMFLSFNDFISDLENKLRTRLNIEAIDVMKAV